LKTLKMRSRLPRPEPMTSEQQRASNRLNAAKSSGPRSSAGRRRASGNSYRHGLAASLPSIGEQTQRVEELACEIAGDTANPVVLQHARAAAQAELDLGLLLSRRATILGSSLRARTAEQKAAIAQELRDRIWPLLPKRDPIAPLVDSVYPFEQAAQAHERLESSAHIGKIVLVVDGLT